MILYLTKQTMERYKFKMPEDINDPLVGALTRSVLGREGGDRLLEWGGKLFYFDRRKCIQVVNFASKLTLVLIDVKMEDRENIGALMAHYMFNLYKDNRRMTEILKIYFEEHPSICIAPLKDKSIIATLNRTQSHYLLDGYLLAEYIRDGILHSLELNNDLNQKNILTQKTDGKTDYFYPAERFEQLMIERYGK